MSGLDGMFTDLEYDEIEQGQQYQFEEKYFTQAVVTVLNKSKGGENGEYRQYELRIDSVLGGTYPMLPGYEFTVAFNETAPRHYKTWKLKPVGSATEYVMLK